MFLKRFIYFTVSTLTIEKRQPWDCVPYRILTCQKSKMISIRLLENRVFARRECYKNTESLHLIELRNRLRNFKPVKNECHIPQHPAKNDFGGQSHQYFTNASYSYFLQRLHNVWANGRRAKRGYKLRSSLRPFKRFVRQWLRAKLPLPNHTPTLKMFFNR